ncbi:MAG: non-homologous end-joining DNA ligase [Nocardiopsaceae bacterium]|nr:non-homologous end-joining DNA ligase [Nocardiopsaceae bacterium]
MRAADVRLSRPSKTLFPDDGLTKGDLVAYYERMAPCLLGYLRGRPLVMGRYPDGIDGEGIVQKNVPRHFPGWVRRAEIGKQHGTVTHVICDTEATLVYLANQASIELHVFLSRLGALEAPEAIVFDLDPPDPSGFGDACRNALRLRGLLEDELGLVAYVKTTGGKGLHVHVPLRTDDDFGSVRGFAREAADLLAGRYPDELTTEQRIDQRGRRLYLDVMRNAYAQTVIVPYGVRARPGAPVATPMQWEEVEKDGLSPGDFTIGTVPGRQEREGDPWKDMARRGRGLSAPRRALARLH